MTDPFYTLNKIDMELNNLNRDHVYYSIDEQPEVCAALIAESYLTKFFPRKWSKSNQEIEGIPLNNNQAQEWLEKSFRKTMDKMVKEALFGHRVSVTVQSWDDAPAAIGLIRERQREFKKGMGR